MPITLKIPFYDSRFPFLDDVDDTLGDVWRGIVAAGREAGPVVEVDDFNVTVGAHNAVAAINLDVQLVGSVGADALEVLNVKLQALRLAVDGFVSVLAVTKV